MHARGGLEHERSDDVASHRRKDPSRAIMRRYPRKSRNTGRMLDPRPASLQYYEFIGVICQLPGVTLVPRGAACRALVQLLHASTKETLQHPAQMQASVRRTVLQHARAGGPRNACGVSSHARSLSTLRGSPHDVSSERAEESIRGLLQYLQWRRGHGSAELRGR